MEELTEIYKDHCKELPCIPTYISPAIPRISGISTVIFDIYGTLLISGSGDIGASTPQEEILRAILQERIGLQPPRDLCLTDLLTDSIKEEHLKKQSQGTTFPEVDIREHWVAILSPFRAVSDTEIEAIATLYEAQTNPVWPMPNARDTLSALTNLGLRLGIISNAQFYTHALFPALLPEASFDPSLSVYSYQERHAKPGLYLFEKMVSLLNTEGIRPDEVLYIGNDMRNDINPANQVGFHTVLFAGDARSYRPRVDQDYEPADSVISDLSQLTGLLL